jgi:hypothetical protein
MRYSESGAGVKICPLTSAGCGICLNGDILVTAAGDVVDIAQGKVIDNLPFPKAEHVD